MITRLRERMNSDESGFTLIELLVVIIIIGILAAIAIPIFLNQQKTARDGATTSDVRNLATNVQTALTSYPNAVVGTDITLGSHAAADTEVTLTTPGNPIDVSKSAGTELGLKGGGPGAFVAWGYNEAGQAYVADYAALVYDSAAGGLQSGANDPADFPADAEEVPGDDD